MFSASLYVGMMTRGRTQVILGVRRLLRGAGRGHGSGALAELPHGHLDRSAERDTDEGPDECAQVRADSCSRGTAPTSTARRTQNGLSRTVLLMMTGFRTWFSTCW